MGIGRSEARWTSPSARASIPDASTGGGSPGSGGRVWSGCPFRLGAAGLSAPSPETLAALPDLGGSSPPPACCVCPQCPPLQVGQAHACRVEANRTQDRDGPARHRKHGRLSPGSSPPSRGHQLRSVSQHYSALLEVVSGQFRPAPTEWASTAERAWRADLSRSM